jgi:membrane protein DedA with SNARE-associated domain
VILRLVGQFGYLALTLLLIAGGLGVPVPEEILQLTAGYLSRRGTLALLPALLSVYLGIVLGDLLFFRFAQAQGPKLLARPSVTRVLTPGRRALLERHFARHAFLTIVVARHASGLRLAAYALAAVNGVRTRTFVLADALSALLSVPLVVSLGWLFAAHIEDVKRRVHQVELGITIAAVLVAAGVVAWKWARAARIGLPRDGRDRAERQP